MKAGERLQAWRVRWEAQCAADAEAQRQHWEREVQAAWAPLCAEFEANVGVPLTVTLPDLKTLPCVSADGVQIRADWWWVTTDGLTDAPKLPYKPLTRWSVVAATLANEGKPHA